MIYGLYQSAAGMMTNEYRHGVLANNLANADTVGFKRDVAVFAERLRADQAGVRRGPSDPRLGPMTGGVWLGQAHTDFSEGALVRTENSLDVALAGPGFLVVEASGQTLLTRDGRMVRTFDGRLVSAADGASILGVGGQPLRVNPRGGEVTVDELGRVEQDGLTVGQLGVTDVADYDALRKVGGGRFAFDPQQVTAAPARVMSGFVENSAVEPVTELVSMLEASRAYQLNAQMVTLQDQTVGRLINAVATS